MNTDNNADATMVKLVSNLDDRIFEVSMAAIQISQVCLDAAGEVDGDENEDEYDNENVKTIPLDVSGPNLEMIVDFMKHYQKEKMNEVKFSGDSFEMVSYLFLLFGWVVVDWFGCLEIVFLSLTMQHDMKRRDMTRRES
mmetsp:Transcript_7836/g.16811  ORF Transcript_7836/g.16811 Transcript_7836/m.16811 type:complete len:139 (-) Transcript_7836:517-933(-)